MACPACGANSWEHTTAVACGPIRCTKCGYTANEDQVKQYRREKAEEKTEEGSP
jgi:predicted Zn-ribbon and HTH transcriptional regulator